ncbi:antibiotic acetyltransferase [Bosea caraganae]|uniref:Antibiotic acetyltransferase n=1 Tax=Bosea caraganae TaxID=2763117 RepID=A0A370L2X1_9HYPH|nr:CatB-related O-acetyltransferase [Bosea caraganae]RDJ21518.1 antibiotic acetyltransferase [Bosea caraganae]RDJ23486.1 antibiotic acetyltransferase [Bosea caraganae]
MPSEPGGLLSPEDALWRPDALAAWWAGLPQGPRGFLRKRINPGNQTRLHLAHLIAKRPGQISAGAYTYGRPKVRFPESGAKLTIGRYGSIADGVEILLGGNHRTEWATTYPFPALPGLWPEATGMDGHDATRGDVSIGHDVWIGSQAMILSGVTIGHGAVIAACAVVVKDVAPYAIVGGNPAREIRKRLPEADIAALLDARWWDLPETEVRKLLPLLMSENVGGLVERIRSGAATGA